MSVSKLAFAAAAIATLFAVPAFAGQDHDSSAEWAARQKTDIVHYSGTYGYPTGQSDTVIIQQNSAKSLERGSFSAQPSFSGANHSGSNHK
jgi:hypothetical protein